MQTRPRLEIDLNIIRQNYTYLQSVTASAESACVLKNDAYGLGAKEVGTALYQAGCRTFFVAHGLEGANLRAVAPEARIFTLQGYGTEDEALFRAHNLIPVLPTLSAVENWFKKPANTQMPAIQVETGLNRLGISLTEAAALQEKSFSLILSHLACADDITHPLNQQQYRRLNDFKKIFKKTPFSLSASDGIFLGKNFHFDVVRLGAALYGLNTAPHLKKYVRNCMRVTAPILQIKTVLPNESVGYGATYQTKRLTKIATASIGYADGIFRSFSPNGALHVCHAGQIYRAPIVGRVSMDNITCDVSNIPDQILNSITDITIIDDFYDPDTCATVCGTIGYEILNNIGHATRYQRIYIK